MNFKAKLKDICKQEGINLKDFSNLSGIPYQSIKSYSSGQREPELAQILKISEVPRFAKYRNMLLSLNEPIGEDAEFMVLYQKACEAGKEQQALDYLRFLAAQEDKQ